MSNDREITGLPNLPYTNDPELFAQLNELYQGVQQAADNIDKFAYGDASIATVSRIQLQSMWTIQATADVSFPAFVRVGLTRNMRSKGPLYATGWYGDYPVNALGITMHAVGKGGAVNICMMGRLDGLSGLIPGMYYSVDYYNGVQLNSQSINFVALSPTQLWFSPFPIVHGAGA